MASAPASTSAVPQTHRASFNEAYQTLEQAIRNFSKEKLMYEQTIEGLNKQMSLAQESFQKLNLEHQDVLAENKRLVSLHEENEKTRIGLDALIASVERKQEIISETVEGFEKVEQDIFNRYEAHEEFLYCLKFRQLQLLNWIDETAKKNEALQLTLTALQRNYDVQLQELKDAKALMEKSSCEFAEEKALMLRSHKLSIDELEQKLRGANDDIQRVKMEQESLQASRNELQIKLDTTLKELESTKTLMEQNSTNYAEEKLMLVNNHKSAIEKLTDDLSREKIENDFLRATLNELQIRFDITFKELEATKELMVRNSSSHAEEKLYLADSHKTAIDKLSTEFQACQEEHQREKMERESLQTSLDDLQIRFDNALKELEAAKKLMEQNSASYADEKLTLTNDHKNIVDKLTKELQACQEETQCEKKEHDKLKGAFEELKTNCDLLAKELSETKISMEEAARVSAEEKATLLKEHDQAVDNLAQKLQLSNEEIDRIKQECETLQTTLSQVQTKYDEVLQERDETKTLLAETQSSYVKEKEELIGNHNEEMDRLTADYQHCKGELKALFNRYQDQKQAISKLVEEAGVRPVVLPSKESNRTRAKIPGTPVSSCPEKSETPKTYGKNAFLVPGRSRNTGSSTPSRTESAQSQSRGILKRAKDDSVNNKNVSFGATTITDFNISSCSDTETSSGETYNPKKQTEAAPVKRMRLSETKKDAKTDDGMMDEDAGEDAATAEKPARRFFKNKIGGPKSPILSTQ